MGYCINLMDADFFISGDKKDKALKALKKMAKTAGHLSWVTSKALLECKTLEKAMEEFRWPVILSEDLDSGDICGINFEGEKSGCEDELFDCLAPFVRHGSWIEIHGEDRAMWRSYFRNGKHEIVKPQIIWPED